MKENLIQGTSLSALLAVYKLVTHKKEGEKFSQQEADLVTGVVEHHQALGLGKHLGTTKKLANGAQKEDIKKFTDDFGKALTTFGVDINPAEPVGNH